MSTPRFYLHPLPDGERAVISGKEALHAAGARRLRVGDALVLFDGLGGEADAVVSAATSDRVDADIRERRSRTADTDVRLTVAVAVPKGTRSDALVAQCTEIGVAALQPTQCERSEVHPRDAKLDRWRRIAVEACKQSQRAWIPDIAPIAPFDALLASSGNFDVAILLHPEPDAPTLAALCTNLLPGAAVLAMIGPEGGFSESERAAAKAAGVPIARFGRTILRIETAAVAAAAIVLNPARAAAPET